MLVRSNIWMPFGDIVLQAESTQFRVNRDSLTKQSTVFADMFSIPQPPNEPTVEGCPVVTLSGDSAKDWELLLGVLYDPFGDQEALPFNVIAAMLRLGRKYGIAAAEANAIRRIHFEFPKELDARDKFLASFTKIHDYEELVLDVLNVAHEFGINSSIPAIAYSVLDIYPLDEILTGIKRLDESTIVLHPDIQKLLAIGSTRITTFQFRTSSWFDNDDVVPSELCIGETECEDGLAELRHCFRREGRSGTHASFALKSWHEDWSNYFCASCAIAARDAFTANRVKAWDALPSFFGFPNWDELKDVE